mgnify:CR=1 FL=1
MATTSTAAPRIASRADPRQLVRGRRRARLTESLLGILFVAPVAIIAIVFELFPVLYGFFISMQGGVLVPQGFIGLTNFVRALGSLAYMIGLAVAVIFALGGYLMYMRARTAMQSGRGIFRSYLLPSFITAPSLILSLGLWFFIGFEYGLIPLIGVALGIGLYYQLNAQQGDDPNRLLYVVNSLGVALFSLSSVLLVLFVFAEIHGSVGPMLDLVSRLVTNPRFNYIFPLMPQFLAMGGTLAALIAIFVIHQHLRHIDRSVTPRLATWLDLVRAFLVVAAIGFIMYVLTAQEALRATLTQMDGVTQEQLRQITRLRLTTIVEGAQMWMQVYTMLLGIGLIGLAYYLWSNARREERSRDMVGSIVVAILLMVGGWAFIGELPIAAGSGDPDFYRSLLRTATYAFITVPVQLAIGLGLAYLLFYEVRWGKSTYRLIFFMPYIAPTVATATVFAMIFSLNPTSPANQIVQGFGLPPLQWLRDPRGVFQILAEIIGGPGTRLPDFLVGPSLPLMSAILYGIWVFSGYNAVIFLAGLGNVPREMHEAAQVDGAGRWAIFRHIIFPLISPTTFFLTMLGIIGTFRAFSHIWVLRTEAARGAMDTTTVYVYQIILESSVLKTRPYAASLSFLLFGIILILTVVQNRLSRDRVFYG